MSDSNELIIDPQLLAEIRRQCQQRAAELEAARSAAEQAIETPASTSGMAVNGSFEEGFEYLSRIS